MSRVVDNAALFSDVDAGAAEADALAEAATDAAADVDADADAKEASLLAAKGEEADGDVAQLVVD